MAKPELTPMQKEVVCNRGGSLLVAAAAGSGKTKVLVDRLFRYVTEEHANVDDFLIITFTKAAAAELKGKIAAELSDRLAESPSDAHLRKQLLRVYRADVKTVDAFCTALLREHIYLLADEQTTNCLTPDFRVLDDSEADLIRRRVLMGTMERFYETLGEGDTQLADTLGAGRDDRALESLVLELFGKLQSHAYPERWLSESKAGWNFPDDAAFDDTIYAKLLLENVARKATYCRNLLETAVTDMVENEKLTQGYASRFSLAVTGFAAVEKAVQIGWDETVVAAERIEFQRLGQVRDADAADLKRRMKQIWDDCKAAAKKLQAQLSMDGATAMEDLRAVAPAMRSLLDLTTTFYEDYRQEKLRRNVADFSDQEHLALKILVDEDELPTELGCRLSARYREIMVDEYQDTNEVQNHIFRAISREGTNLFTVGDVKQSIYRFRLADPTIFLKKYNTFPLFNQAAEREPRKIALSKNFRSRRGILDATNFVFENIMSEEMGEMAYGEAEKLHFGATYYPERNDCQTEFHLVSVPTPAAGDKGVRRETAEAQFVAERIRHLLDEQYPVTGNGNQMRPCRPEDIVILMRAPGSRLRAFSKALAAQNIPCSFASGGDFFATIEITVMLSLLMVIDNPRQDVPLISVLSCPIFGFTPDRLARLRGQHSEGDFYDALSQDKEPDSQAFLEKLARLRQMAQDMSVYRLLWRVYNAFNVLGVFGAMEGGEQRKENLIALFEHAKRFDDYGYRGVFSFVTQLHKLMESGNTPATRGATGGAGVRLISIHKSKGLEFPIVILADLNHAFNRQDFNTSVLVHPQLGLGPNCVDLTRKIKYPTTARMMIEQKLWRENKGEEQRILYVAMTRAKEKLILVDAVTHAKTHLQKLISKAECPVLPETISEGKSFGDWILLPLLCRPEAKPLRDVAEMEVKALYTGDTAPWQVALHENGDVPKPLVVKNEQTKEPSQPLTFDETLLEFVYPYAIETNLPAKVTATQLKGREVDNEIAENTIPKPHLRPLSQPKFRQRTHALTPAERGTATHVVMQYLNFFDFDVAGQIQSLLQKRLLTAEQAAAVDPNPIVQFLHTPLAEELRTAHGLRREYRFTMLIPASQYHSSAASDDEILLQGIVDCCFETTEGITVVDFKTDHVWGRSLQERAERYRTQLEAYSIALSAVLEKPVTRRILYFLAAGQEVSL